MQLADTFAALVNATRLAIVERLLREGELSAGELVAGETMSPPAVSHHFKVIRDVGLIRQRVDRQHRLYSVRQEALEAIGTWSLTYRQFWEGSLDRTAFRGGTREVFAFQTETKNLLQWWGPEGMSLAEHQLT